MHPLDGAQRHTRTLLQPADKLPIVDGKSPECGLRHLQLATGLIDLGQKCVGIVGRRRRLPLLFDSRRSHNNLPAHAENTRFKALDDAKPVFTA